MSAYPDRSTAPTPERTSMLRGAVVTGLLYLGASLTVQLLDEPTSMGAVFWPGAGITVTALLVSHRRAWAPILTAVALAELAGGVLLGHGPSATSLFWVLANLLGPLGIVLLVERTRDARLPRAASTVRFVATTLLMTTLAGSVGAVGTLLTGTDVPYWLIALRWAIGDGLGVLTVVPVGLLVCGVYDRTEVVRGEALVALAVTAATAVLVFLPVSALSRLPVAYLVLPPMMWTAARLGMGTTGIAIFVVAQVSNAGTALGHGPFASGDLSALTASTLSQLFLGVATVTALLLATSRAESAAFEGLAATREQLIAAVSHELRTPLTPILGFSELLLHRAEPQAATREGLEVIHRNAGHLTRVVDELLQLTRARRGALLADPAPVDVIAVVTELGRDHDVAITVVRSPAVAMVDPTHLTQIVSNLLTNAARYGRPPIELRVDRRGDDIEVAVQDHGEGVPAWFVPQLFDEFSQAEVGDRRTAGGLGLGLPIARDLARANGGDLRYVAITAGARFVLRLRSETQHTLARR